MSPTSKCFASTPAPFVSAGPSVGPAPTGGHLDVIVVPVPSPPSAMKREKEKQLAFIEIDLSARLNVDLRFRLKKTFRT